MRHGSSALTFLFGGIVIVIGALCVVHNFILPLPLVGTFVSTFDPDTKEWKRHVSLSDLGDPNAQPGWLAQSGGYDEYRSERQDLKQNYKVYTIGAVCVVLSLVIGWILVFTMQEKRSAARPGHLKLPYAAGRGTPAAGRGSAQSAPQRKRTVQPQPALPGRQTPKTPALPSPIRAAERGRATLRRIRSELKTARMRLKLPRK